MSMNLAFEVKGGGIVDFPYQTPTRLTKAVLACHTREERLALLRAERGDQDLAEIDQLLQKPNLELIMV